VNVPWLVSAGSAAQLLPIVAGAIRHAHLSGPRKWMVGWCAVLAATDGLVLFLAMRGTNNHWVNYVATPVTSGLVLWALSHWQLTKRGKTVLRILIPGLAISWIAMVVSVEDMTTFSLVAGPFQGLLLMGAAIWVLVTRTARETGRLREQDWLWIGIGLVVYFGSVVALPPASYLLMATSPQLVIRAYEIRGALNILAFMLIARGFFCRSRGVG